MANRRKKAGRKQVKVAALLPPGLEWLGPRKPPRRANGRSVESLAQPRSRSKKGRSARQRPA